MAIDTANKRSSAVNVSSPWRSRLPFPDGAIDQADRQHVALMYSGIQAAGTAPLINIWEVCSAEQHKQVIEIIPY